MTTKPRHADFIRYLEAQGTDYDSLDAIGRGVKWRGYARSLEAN